MDACQDTNNCSVLTLQQATLLSYQDCYNLLKSEGRRDFCGAPIRWRNDAYEKYCFILHKILKKYYTITKETKFHSKTLKTLGRELTHDINNYLVYTGHFGIIEHVEFISNGMITMNPNRHFRIISIYRLNKL